MPLLYHPQKTVESKTSWSQSLAQTREVLVLNDIVEVTTDAAERVIRTDD